MVSMHNNELMRWWALQPVTTKWIGLLSLLIPVLLKFRLLPAEYVVFYWPWIWRNLQVWRPFSSIFIANLNLNIIMSVYFRWQYSSYLETIQFAGRPADYLWFLLLSLTLATLFNAYLGLAVLWETFTMTIVYVWAQYNKAVTVSFLFGFRFPAVYLPFVMAAADLVMGGNVMGALLGILVGHTYYFTKEIMGIHAPLQAPRWLDRFVRQPRLAPGESMANSAGFTMQAPKNPLHAKKTDTDSGTIKFRPFAGQANKLGSE